jgi:peroxiredoxin
MTTSPISGTTEELATARSYYRNERIPSAALAIMDAATDALVASGISEGSLQPGDFAPDFQLPDASGGEVRLSTELERGPVVVVFYRGGWCPYCNVHLRGFQLLLQEFLSAGAQLIAISPQLPDGSLSTREKNELTFPVLSDVGLSVAGSFGIAFELPEALLDLYADFDHPLELSNGVSGGRSLPIPATFVIDQDGRIAYAKVEADYTRRSEPLDVLAIVRQLSL